MKKVFDFKLPKPFDPGIPKENYEAYEDEAKKTNVDDFTTTVDGNKEPIDAATSKTTLRILIKYSVVDDGSGSKSLNDDILFQQVDPVSSYACTIATFIA